ncbi:hypothetical protein M9H77_07202 [Catharanthus roseus]|uniref:Uncharacterized protein n=1 Tax=Catharanthus roseus TaxID=4058 RepID=A0ACC0BU86_CATRO|nr:hypothetical protein M9H77_07202 [Catharanthus roseus]
MVKVKNANIGRGENVEEGESSREIVGKGKRVPSGIRAPDRFISVKEAANFEEWIRKRRKIAPGHRVDMNDMGGIEIIPNLFNGIGWGSMLIVNELFYSEMIFEFYANLHKGRAQKVGNITHQWVLPAVGGRDITFDDRLLNNILETPDDGIRFYTKNKKIFEEIFTKGEVLIRLDDRNVNKLDAYGRLVHHMISNIIIPNVGHKSSITNMHSFVMLALHEHRRMNFGFMAIEHMLATQSSSTKFLPYGYFLTKIIQYFVLNLVGVGEPIGPGKIYNKHTFNRMGDRDFLLQSFKPNTCKCTRSINEEGMLFRGGQDESEDENDKDDEENEEQEATNVEEEESEEKAEEEHHRKEIRKKKRQERAEKGSSKKKLSIKNTCFEM